MHGSNRSNSFTLTKSFNVGLIYSLLIVQRLSVQSGSFYTSVNSRIIDYVELTRVSMKLMIKKKVS